MSASKNNFFDKEIVSIITNGKSSDVISHDNGPRHDQTIEKLTKLRPYFDRKYGTVTVGNSCPITDGAAMLILKENQQSD